MTTPSSDDEADVTAHYFDAAPDVASAPTTVALDLPDRSMTLTTDRGVFSGDRVDPGTKLLLMELPELAPGPAVDVGCGYGPIACTIAARQPDSPVWAVDVNDRARALCVANADSLGLDVTVIGPDEVPDDLRVTSIVSNPPIRVGKAVLHNLLEFWLDRLDEGGEAWLVVHKHLGADSLAKWLEGSGRTVERVRSRQGYRILRVR